jgi:hypothetical protein
LEKNSKLFILDLTAKESLKDLAAGNVLFEAPDGNCPFYLSLVLNAMCRRGTGCPSAKEAAEWTVNLGRFLANLSPRLEELRLNFSHANCSIQLLDVLSHERLDSLSFPRLEVLHLSKWLPCTSRGKSEPESKALFEVGQKILRLSPKLHDLDLLWQPLEREVRPDEVLPEDELLRSLPPILRSLKIEKTFSHTTAELLAAAHLPELRSLSLSLFEHSLTSQASLNSIFEGVSFSCPKKLFPLDFTYIHCIN